MKKTTQVFQIILNHFFYYKMMKEQVCTSKLPILEEFHGLQREVNALRIQHEKSKMSEQRAQNELVQTRAEGAALKTQLQEKETEVEKSRRAFEELSAQKVLLIEKVEQLRLLVVEDSEAVNLLAMKSELEQRTGELVEEEHCLNSRTVEVSFCKQEITGIIQEIERILSQFSGEVEYIG